MKKITTFLITFLITAIFAANITAQDKLKGKHDNSNSPVWKLFKVDREYTQQNFRTISERDAMSFAERTDAANKGNANAELIRSLRKQFPEARLQGLLLPKLNRFQCATTQDMVLISPVLEGYPNPLDGPGGVVVGDLCSQDGEELCDNCGGCEGRDPATGSYKTCICTRSAKVCRACPSC